MLSLRNTTVVITLLMTAIIMVVFLGFQMMQSRLNRRLLYQESERGLRLMLQVLSAELRVSMINKNKSAVSMVFEKIITHGRIEHVRILGHQSGKQLTAQGISIAPVDMFREPACGICHIRGAGVKSYISSKEMIRPIIVRQKNKMQAYLPIIADSGCLVPGCHSRDQKSRVVGIIDLRKDLTEEQRIIAKYESRLMFGSLIAALFGAALIIVIMQRLLRKPIEALLQGIRRASRGDLEYRIPHLTNNDFGELSAAFNTMSQRLMALHNRLVRSERLVSMGKLAAGVAHEINNPLTGILSYTEDLMETLDRTDPRYKDCQVIVHETLRCRKIIRDLLDFARQETPQLRDVSAREIVERSLAILAPQKDFKNITFETEFQDDIPLMCGDPTQLQQVLINLLVNAQQAMPHGGKIRVSVKLVDEWQAVAFIVQDQGCGIPPAIRERIFEPFFSTKEGRTDGLGLAVTAGIVQQHGGRINIESTEGKGTTFTVVIPLCQESDNPQQQKDDENDSQHLTRG